MTLDQFAQRYPTLQYAHLKIIERIVEQCRDEAAAGRWLDLIDSEQGCAERLVSCLATFRAIWHCERRAIVLLGTHEEL